MIRLLLFVFVLFCYSNIQSQSVDMPQEARQDNQIVKSFPYNIDLYDTAFVAHNSADLFKNRKKPLILMFWLTTCGPCRMELSAIKSKYANWKKEEDFDLVAISTDFVENHLKFVDRVKTENWPFPSYRDVRREFSYVLPGGLNGLPQVFVFDKKGNVVYHKRRYIPGDEDALFDAVKAL